MLLGVIADDFTGASDIASMLARGGMRTELLIGLPPGASVAADAGVVALKSRSIPAREAVRQSLGALDWLLLQGCRQIVFKYCSTFDSTPAGNIGPVAEALAERLGTRGVVACPALPENGRTVYLGHLFVKGRLLSESGLEHHPLNPMTDPDIRRWLARQSHGDVGLVDHATVSRGAAAIRAALEAAPESLVIVDALEDRDLLAIGEAVADAPLVTGGSGVAMALPQNFRRAGLLRATEALSIGLSGDGVVLSGSCSPMTRSQVTAFADQHPSLAVNVDALMSGADVVSVLAAFAETHRSESPILYSSTDPEIVGVLQQRYGRERLAAALEALFGDLALRLLRSRFARLVVAGGETSDAVISAVGVDRFAIGPEITHGVPALLGEYAGAPLAVALKSGNFGGADFFAKALDMLQGRG